jgi:hypothetical protein
MLQNTVAVAADPATAEAEAVVDAAAVPTLASPARPMIAVAAAVAAAAEGFRAISTTKFHSDLEKKGRRDAGLFVWSQGRRSVSGSCTGVPLRSLRNCCECL